MKQFKVVVPDDVWDQISEQVLYIAQDSVDRALAWEVRLRAAIESLGFVHGYARDEDASARFNSDIRKYVFEGTYLIHYSVDNTAGEVTWSTSDMAPDCHRVANHETGPAMLPITSPTVPAESWVCRPTAGKSARSRLPARGGRWRRA